MTPSAFGALDTQPMGQPFLFSDFDLRAPSAVSTSAEPLPVAAPKSPDSLWGVLQSPAPAIESATRLGEALCLSGLIDKTTLRRALEMQRNTKPHRLIGGILVEQGALTDSQLRMALARWLGVRVIDPRVYRPEVQALQLVSRVLAERESVLPLMVREDALVVLMSDPWDKALVDQLRFITQHRIVVMMAAPGTLMPSIYRAYAEAATGGRNAGSSAAAARNASVEELATELRQATQDARATDEPVVSESDNTLVRMVNSIIQEAIARRASDIHIETADAPRQVRVRLRIDGELTRLIELPSELRFALVARLKIMADLDIAEHRKPQDGKIDFARFGGPHVELRVVTVPTSRGLEDVVLRLLSGLKPLPLNEVGLSDTNLRALRDAAAKPYGLILICGPTGCGKTTTLHSLLRDLNTDGRKIWTAEDPIEITQEGLRQVQVNPRIGWTFAQAMRTFLRADPDVIMIGEMRDEETARIAVEASLTGHLVLSTLHTNSAPESITRLLEIGLDPYNFSDSLLGILAQRLVRRLCTHCRKPHTASDQELLKLADIYLADGSTTERCAALVAQWRKTHGRHGGAITLYDTVGCEHCGSQGYHGRLGIHELMLTNDAVREHIRHREGANVLKADAQAIGMQTLRQDGIGKVLSGLTDLREVLAATNQ